MMADGMKLSYVLLGSIQGGIVTFKRINPTDNNHCFYRGEVKNDGSMTGTMFCGSSKTSWNAKKVKDAQ
jgi:hypothetical protein